MTDKEFLYSMYNKDIVDDAIDHAKNYRNENESALDLKMLETYKLLPDGDKMAEEFLHERITNYIVYSYLHGVSYAVRHEIGSVEPSEERFSDYHKNVDFAVLFDFGDNDFGSHMSNGARIYCDQFNSILRQIDLYNDIERSKNGYIKELEDFCDGDVIKEVLKIGFFAYDFESEVEHTFNRMPNFQKVLGEVQKYLEYIPWDTERTKWEKVDDEYVESEKFPRFVVGTKDDIEKEICRHGSPYEKTEEEKDFPVWCNGEVLVMYMKDGYLRYLIR